MSETLKVTLQIVGPLKRSRFHREAPPDRCEEAIGDILHWSHSLRLQMGRFGQSLQSEFQKWGALSRIRKRHFSATSYDEHMLLVAAANLDRALNRAPKRVRAEVPLTETWRRALWLLRHIYEHWDVFRSAYQSKGRPLSGAAQKLCAEFPSADPWSFTYEPTSGAIVMADVVPLKPLWKELRLLEARMLRLSRRYKNEQMKPPSAE